MKHAHNRVRLSLDISASQHIHLKMMATKKGMSMREYILEALAFKEEKEDKKQIAEELDPATFRKGLKKLRKDYAQFAKNLSKR